MVYLNETIRSIKNINWLQIFIDVVIVVVLLYLIFVFVDYLMKDKYKIKIRRATLANDPGHGMTYFVNYWVWQQNKKKMAINELSPIVQGVFAGRALKRKKAISGSLIIRRRVYGTAK